MKIALFTLTWNRLYYTQHCFARLKELAGYDYRHLVIDNGSMDGTQDWLIDNGYETIQHPKNMGLTHGYRQAIDRLKDYDLVIKFDNDCELETPDTLKTIADFYEKHGDDYLVSPKIWGLNNPPKKQRTIMVGDYQIEVTGLVGGIFQPIARKHLSGVYELEELRDHHICNYLLSQSATIGYLTDLSANHFETTNGQLERYGPKAGYIY
jgi:GT2 family glycosyltransferase